MQRHNAYDMTSLARIYNFKTDAHASMSTMNGKKRNKQNFCAAEPTMLQSFRMCSGLLVLSDPRNMNESRAQFSFATVVTL